MAHAPWRTAPWIVRRLGLSAPQLSRRRVRAADPPTAIIVFDGSGSMWGKHRRRAAAKFAIARDALKAPMSALKPDARSASPPMAIRRQADCSDTQVIVAAGGRCRRTDRWRPREAQPERQGPCRQRPARGLEGARQGPRPPQSDPDPRRPRQLRRRHLYAACRTPGECTRPSRPRDRPRPEARRRAEDAVPDEARQAAS